MSVKLSNLLGALRRTKTLVTKKNIIFYFVTFYPYVVWLHTVGSNFFFNPEQSNDFFYIRVLINLQSQTVFLSLKNKRLQNKRFC
jgi:hypothetical protein